MTNKSEYVQKWAKKYNKIKEIQWEKVTNNKKLKGQGTLRLKVYRKTKGNKEVNTKCFLKKN